MEKIGKLTVSALQEILRERGLSTSYRKKQELIERVLELVSLEGDNSDLGRSIREESDSEEFYGFEEPKVEDSTMNDQKPGSSFAFRDVEESLETFNGESGKGVKAWLKDFADIATVCRWDEIQKYLYARRLLRGAAKLAIEAASGIHSWELLEETLEKEFGESPTSISVHRSLEARKKASTESFLEYMYTMKQIASRVTMDEESLISYIVAGIADDVQSKAVLYEAKTLEELKSKFKTYEVMKVHRKLESSGRRNQSVVAPAVKGKQSSVKRCYNCGSKSHLTANCPDKSKGARCFNCGNYGHMSANCPQPRVVRPTTSELAERGRNSVSIISSPDLSVEVKLGEGQYKALVDTGSGVTLIRESIMENSRVRPEGQGPSIALTGFGQNLKRTLGSIQTSLTICGDKYSTRCHIVPDNWITSDILIGTDIIKLTCLRVEDGKVTLTRSKEAERTSEVNFLEKIDVVQLVGECVYDSLEIDNSDYKREVWKLISEYAPKS